MKACGFLRSTVERLALLCLVATLFLSAKPLRAQDETLVQAGDLIFGLSRSDPLLSMELIRGPATEFGGEVQVGLWTEPFIQAVELDNLNAISHNPNGNLLGVNFGSTDTGGSIFSLATLAADVPAQLIGNTMGLGGDGLDTSRLGGVSISPDNATVAVTGYDTGRVLFFDYTAGNGSGEGAALSGARQSAAETFPAFSTHGSTWLDSNRVIVFGTDGELTSVNADTLDVDVLATVDTGTQDQSSFTDVEYNPTVSPYVYASNGAFDGTFTTNQIYVFDPAAEFELVTTIDFSQSSQTFREIALGPLGDLFITQFSGLIDFVPGMTDPLTVADDSSVDWYIPIETPSFSGIDVAIGLPIDLGGLQGDFNEDGVLDAADINALSAEVRAGTNATDFDVNSDGLVNDADREVWVEELKGTYFGDSNLDGEFGTTDLVTVFQAGEYEDAVSGNSIWETGDWSGDGDFNTGDLVLAFQKGGFDLRGAVASVPEPAGAMLLLIGLLFAPVPRALRPMK